MGRLKLRQCQIPQFAMPGGVGEEEAWDGLERRIVLRAKCRGHWDDMGGKVDLDGERCLRGPGWSRGTTFQLRQSDKGSQF